MLLLSLAMLHIPSRISSIEKNSWYLLNALPKSVNLSTSFSQNYGCFLLDFKALKRSQKSRGELHGVSITWVKVYEIEKVCVKIRHGHFKEDLVKRLIEYTVNEIFDIAVVSPTKLKLEFINSEARRRWFSQKNVIESSHNVFCSLYVKQVERHGDSTH